MGPPLRCYRRKMDCKTGRLFKIIHLKRLPCTNSPPLKKGVGGICFKKQLLLSELRYEGTEFLERYFAEIVKNVYDIFRVHRFFDNITKLLEN